MSKEFPDDLRYTKDHEWVRVEGKQATIGISQFAVDSLGDITQVELPKEGESIVAGRTIGSVESVKAVSDVYAPVSGKVIKVNDPLLDAPESLNEDCYDEGWMVVIELSKPQELDALMDVKTYSNYVKESEH